MVLAPSGVRDIEQPSEVVIQEDEGAYFLLRLSPSGVSLADTWHETVEEAKRQALFEYGIVETDWTTVTARATDADERDRPGGKRS